MSQIRPRPSFALAVENLEGRIVQSSLGTALPQGTAMVATLAHKRVSTTTTLNLTAGTLGQPITVNVTVKGPASAGSPTGSIAITDHGRLIQSLPLTPSTTPGAHASQAMVTLTQPPGGTAYYFGKHSLSATFVPNSASFAKSTASKSFTVVQPSYTTLAGGTKIATITPGSGPTIQPGQTANVLYTGYLAKTGQVFDASSLHNETPLPFQVGAGAVVAGFDAGTNGMQVGESRIILIPPGQGYGSTANGPIPANSTLIFVVTLQSIT
jgi:hypothetical protein